MNDIDNSLILGIIGTAGRKQAHRFMTPDNYNLMLEESKKIISKFGFKTVVSGGAAFSDHIAVSLFNNNLVDNLILMLPDSFDIKAQQYRVGHYGNIANELHREFSHQCQINSLQDIQRAIENGAIIPDKVESSPGFLTRNSWIAEKCTHLLAFTSGKALNQTVSEIGYNTEIHDYIIKDNGTKDTWRKASQKYRIVISIDCLISEKKMNPSLQGSLNLI